MARQTTKTVIPNEDSQPLTFDELEKARTEYKTLTEEYIKLWRRCEQGYAAIKVEETYPEQEQNPNLDKWRDAWVKVMEDYKPMEDKLYAMAKRYGFNLPVFHIPDDTMLFTEAKKRREEKLKQQLKQAS